MDNLDSILNECSERLKAHYGDDLADVILYGSFARGEQDEESDIDLLVLLKSDFDRWEEIQAIVELLTPIQMKCDRYISAKPALYDDYRNGNIMYLRNARKEGIGI
ncbi:MAG: nucleotidyltransferase family protein [Candidatus Brocadiia bacterium]